MKDSIHFKRVPIITQLLRWVIALGVLTILIVIIITINNPKKQIEEPVVVKDTIVNADDTIDTPVDAPLF